MRLLQNVLALLLVTSQLFQSSPPERVRVVRVGVYDNPPMAFFADGTAQGFVIDILEAIADEENWDLVYIPCTWTTCLGMLDKGEIDLLGPMVYSGGLAEKYAFSNQTYFTNWGVVYTRPGESIETPIDLDGKTIAVLRDDIFGAAAVDLLADFQSQPKYLFVDDYPSVLRAVAEGRAQAGVVSRLFGQLNAQDFRVVKTPVIFHPVAVRFAEAKTGDPDILTAIDHHLEEWKGQENSPYAQAVARWLTAPHESSEFPRWVIPAFTILAAIIALSLGVIFGLRWTVRKRTAELQASEARNRDLLESIPDLIFQIDGDGVFRDYKSARDDLLYLDPREFINRPAEAVLPEFLARVTLENVQKALAHNEIQQSEYALPINGEEHFFDARYVPSAKNTVTAIVRDVTRQKQTEAALRRSETLFRAVFEQSGEGISLVDREGDYVLVNPAFCRMTGYEMNELLQMNLRVLVPPDVNLKRFPAIWKSGWTGLTEMELVKKDGSRFWAEITIYLVHLGEQDFALGILRDITERKRAERLIRENEERLRTLINATPDIICFKDGQGRWLEANDADLELFMLDGVDYRGKTDVELAEYAHPVFKDAFLTCRETDEQAWQTGGISRGEESIRRPDGTVKIYDVIKVALYEPDGARKGLIVLGRDITERKRAEESLQKYARQLETLTTVMTALTASLALDEVLNLILDQIRLVVPVDSAAVFLKENDKLRVVMDWGITPSAVGLTLPGNNELFDVIKKRNAPLILENPLQDARFANWGASKTIKTWMGVPLIVRNELIGFMTLDSERPQAYRADEIQLVNSFAAQAAQAIDNAIQFRNAQRRLQHLSALREIDQAISSKTEITQTLDVLLEHVIRQLEVDAAAVMLYHATAKHLEFAAGRGFHTPKRHLPNLGMENGFARTVLEDRKLLKILELDEIDTASLCSPEFRAEEFVVYFGVPLIAKDDLVGVLEIYHRSALEPDTEWFSLLETLAGQAAIAIDNINLFASLERTNRELVRAYDATIEGWAHALELRDMETEGHSRRVMDLTLALARKMGITNETELIHIRRGALLHDIGKMGVPDAILNKPGPLTEEEWKIMRQHPTYAYKMLSSIPYLKPALAIPYSHHEKWDGSGYPQGLKGEEIPLAARIFAVVDVWDALGSDRSYRSAWPRERRLDYLRTLAGAHFDPRVVAAFIELLGEQE